MTAKKTMECKSPEDVNECTVFVSSSDAYSDIWPAFFTLFKKAWPQYRGTIYLNTEEKSFVFSGLNIVCTQVGRQRYFGETLQKGLRWVSDGRILFLMIDYFFEKQIDLDLLQHCYDEFGRHSPIAFYLRPYHFANVEQRDVYQVVLPPGNLAWFSFQAAFWDCNWLCRLVGMWESPWNAEFYGCLRVMILKPLVFISGKAPIPYDPAGCLHGGGKWLKSALDKIDLSDVPIDFASRPFYKCQSFSNLRITLNNIKPSVSNIRSVLSVLKLFLFQSLLSFVTRRKAPTHARAECGC